MVKVGDLVTNWPYGEPIPYMGIVLKVKDHLALIMWIPQGDYGWTKASLLNILDPNKKIEFFSLTSSY